MQERLYWNPEVQGLSQDEMDRLRMQKLSRQIRYCYDNSDYYRQKFRESGAEPDDIKTFADFRRLPVFMNKELDRWSEEQSIRLYGHPYGVHLCCPPEKVVRISSTSGTTGLPTYYCFTKNDIAVTNEGWHRIFWHMGLRPGDSVLWAFGLSMWLAGISGVRAVEEFGARIIPCGVEAGTARLLLHAKLNKPTAMACTPSFAEYLITQAPEAAGVEVGELGIKTIFCAGEPGAGLPDVRKRIMDAYGARLYDVTIGIWGVAQASCDTDPYQGMHVLCEDLFTWYDLIDPQTREPIPIEDGAIGEGVMTSFAWEAAPAMRYAFGDLVQVHTEPCKCGLPGKRVRILGRVDDMLSVKGVKVYPAGVKNVIDSFVPRVTGHMRIVLDEPPPRVVPPLKLVVERGEGVGDGDLEQLGVEIKKAMSDRLKFTPAIEFLAPGTLERFTHKSKLLEKTYEKRGGTG